MGQAGVGKLQKIVEARKSIQIVEARKSIQVRGEVCPAAEVLLL